MSKFVFGNQVNAVADADFFTTGMSADYQSADFHIRFYSDASGETPVTPLGGTVAFTGSPDRAEYTGSSGDFRFQDIEYGEFAATQTDSASRPAVNALGVLTKAKLTLTGVTGALYFSAWCERSY